MIALGALGLAAGAVLAVAAAVGSRPVARPLRAGRVAPREAPAAVVAALRAAGAPVDPGVVWRRAVPLLLAGAGLGVVTVGPVPVAALTAGGVLGLRLLPRALERRARRRRDEQLVAWLERLASALRAGSSPSGAVQAVGPGTPWPLSRDADALARAVSRGAGLAGALRRWRTAPDATPAVALTATALELGLAGGGELARAVDRVAASLRERAAARAEVRALATQARTSAALLALAPAGFTALLASVEPRLLPFLLRTPLGLGCLTAGVALQVLGALWMRRITAGAA